MYYAKQIDEAGNIVALHSMSGPFRKSAEFVPISYEEYLALLAEMKPEPTDEISDAEALAIITGEVEA